MSQTAALTGRDRTIATMRHDTIWPLAGVGAAVVVLTAAGPTLHMAFGGIAHWIVITLTAAGAGWAALTSASLDTRRVLVVIAVVAVAMRLLQFFTTPYLSDDIYRYVWDGRVQAAGINPYRYVPAAPELATLRDAAIYPLINRAEYAPTIYPPVAQMAFFAITRLGDSIQAMKLGMLAFEALALLATLSILTALSLPLSRIAAFAWHPLAVWEIAGSGHIDAAMVGVMMLAVLAAINGRILAAGALIAAAALMKPIALLVLPAFWRPWNWRLPALVAATIAVCYLPYLSVGSAVFGFLGGYVQEEGLSEGRGFRFLQIAERISGPLPHGVQAYLMLAALILSVLALAVGFRTDRSRPATIGSAALLLTVFLVLLTPHYPWYYLALVPFLAVYPTSWTLWLLTVGGMQTYQAVPGEWMPDYSLRQIVFHTLVVVALAHDCFAWRSLMATALPARDPIGDMSA